MISMCVLMLVYMAYHQAGNEALIDAFVQGGIVGSVGFTFTIILGTIFVELYQTRRKEYYFWTFALLVPTAIFYYFFPVSFGSVSPSYLLIGVQASALLFFVVNLFNSVRFSFDPLAWWGRYPILLYLLEFFVVGGILEIAFPKEWFSASASPVIPLVFAGTIVVAFTVLVYFLNRKNRRIVVE